MDGRRGLFPSASAAAGLLVCLLCLSPEPAQGGKVLVMPVDGSHWLSMKILVKELSRRGHDVTVLVPESSLLIKGSQEYKTEVHKVPFSQAELDGKFNELAQSVFVRTPEFADLFVNVERLVNFTSLQTKACDSLLDSRELMEKLKAERFEVLLTDPFLPCGSVLAKMFSIPAVYFLRGLPCELDFKANQCPSPPSFVPVFFSGNVDKMNFLQRVKNFVMYNVQSYVCTVLYQHFDDLVGRRIQQGMSYRELLSHGAVWLLRSDFTFEWPRPIMPNMVLIGGINCVKKAPLPADIQEFVDGSGEHGFIVFTLGSMVSDMPEEKANQFFDAFRQIPQRVLWRYTGKVPDDVPKNVKLMKWLPQNDLLGHPKARIFMTHGGTHGIYEGICNGVPMLMFPLFGDQGDNVHRLVARGVAKKLGILDMTVETLVSEITDMIQDKGYQERMATLSSVHLDRPVEPLELATFWTEFVIKHKGASHLRVAAHDLNWFQYHSLDVAAFLLLVVLTALWLTLKSCSFCFRRCCCGSKSGKGKRKKKSA